MKRLLRFLVAPFTRLYRAFFDPRFSRLHERLGTLEGGLADQAEAISAIRAQIARAAAAAAHGDEAVREVVTIVNHELMRSHERLESRLSGLHEPLAAIQTSLAGWSGQEVTGRDIPRTVSEIDGADAELLNFAESHRGFRAQQGLWFNHPDLVAYSDGRMELTGVNERSVEVPFVIASVARTVAPDASILDVGAAESLVSVYLASIGYRVTALDLRKYPISHPDIARIAVPLEEWETDESFDAAICLSSVEHFGLGAYGEMKTGNSLDRLAIETLLRRVVPGGVLILTVPFGRASVDAFERTYDRAGLDALLEGWDPASITFGVPSGDGWTVSKDEPPSLETEQAPTAAVALVVAHRPDA